MVAAQVIGNDTAIAWSGTNGAFELNVGIPVMASNLLESIRLLGNTTRVMAEKMVGGITANVERARFLAEASPSIVTPLNKLIGYERREDRQEGRGRAVDGAPGDDCAWLRGTRGTHRGPAR